MVKHDWQINEEREESLGLDQVALYIDQWIRNRESKVIERFKRQIKSYWWTIDALI